MTCSSLVLALLWFPDVTVKTTIQLKWQSWETPGTRNTRPDSSVQRAKLHRQGEGRSLEENRGSWRPQASFGFPETVLKHAHNSLLLFCVFSPQIQLIPAKSL
uniref:Secreted protein n=1 Tax=Mus musculus TaxID=10090 RepID=Q9D3E0_MOUSE|nr:unnamed protein product [Mus musculus]